MLFVGIREKLIQDLAKLVLREAEDQFNMAYGNPQLCDIIEASIDGSTYAVGHCWRYRVDEAAPDAGYKGDEGQKEGEVRKGKGYRKNRQGGIGYTGEAVKMDSGAG